MTASPLNYTGVSIRSMREPRRAGDMQRPEKRRAISEIYPRFIETRMTGPYENPCPAATTEPSANAPPSRPGANYRPRKSALRRSLNLHVTIDPILSSADATKGQNNGKFDITAGNSVSYVQAQVTHQSDLEIVAEGSMMQPDNQAL